ncbi:uncharacterized protein BDW70DRAFT_125551 [Aspergillus foveolatus]|uniref:uncharacterized protein n=1 Tax=Aspergillus foveolatus TaxID=210207 RepID=UPI003CCE4C1D
MTRIGRGRGSSSQHVSLIISFCCFSRLNFWPVSSLSSAAFFCFLFFFPFSFAFCPIHRLLIEAAIAGLAESCFVRSRVRPC